MNRRFQGGGIGDGFGGATTATGTSYTQAPSNAGGVLVTPGASNVLGSYAQISAALAGPTVGLHLFFQGGFVAGQARDTMVTIATDPLGGTSYTNIIIPDLYVGTPGQLSAGTQSEFFFPIAIPAGHTVGFAAQVNNGTAGALRCIAEFFYTPTGTVKTGTVVEAVGTAAAASNGTAVTPGTAAEGSWVLLGTLVGSAFFFQVAAGLNNATSSGLPFLVDLALSNDGGTTKDILSQDVLVVTNASEIAGIVNRSFQRMYRKAAAGTQVYGRAACSAAPDAGFSMSAYALGPA